MINVVAVLDTMWDWRKQTTGAGLRTAPRFFKINPQNFSGRRLYKLIGPATSLLVTEACKELATHAKLHGTPDPIWLSKNLSYIQGLRSIDVLLVCGKIAQDTFRLCSFNSVGVTIILMPHPAARNWTKELFEEVQNKIRRATK